MQSLTQFAEQNQSISLRNYIIENLISLKEMIDDYNEMSNYPSTNIKKQIASKYNLESKKTNDIQKAILLSMRNERNSRRKYNDDDITWFRRLSDMPSRYKTLSTWLDNESIEFVIFIRQYYENKLKSKKSKFGSLFDLKDSTKSRDWNYVMTAADKYLIDTYNNLNQYVEEHDKTKTSSKQEKQIVINSIKQKLIESTKEFHDEYINKVKNFADEYWDKLPKRIEDSKKHCDELKELYSNEDDAKQSKTIKLKLQEAIRTYNSYLFISKKYSSKKNYVDKCIEDAEEKFEHNINSISERVYKQNFVVSEITVENIQDDAKFYSMYITDGTKKVYCRSVWAAEFSEKMIPHFRFIVTNKK